MRLIWWLVVLLSLIAGGIGYQLTDRTPQWEASAIYTVAPQTTGDQLSYTDIQAANLFIDVMKSWMLDPALSTAVSQAYPGSQIAQPVHLSMQTFSLKAVADQAESARSALQLSDDWLAKSLSRYNQSGEMTKYTALRGEISARLLAPQPMANGGLAFLLTLLITAFVVLFINYYQQAYAHRR